MVHTLTSDCFYKAVMSRDDQTTCLPGERLPVCFMGCKDTNTVLATFLGAQSNDTRTEDSTEKQLNNAEFHLNN